MFIVIRYMVIYKLFYYINQKLYIIHYIHYTYLSKQVVIDGNKLSKQVVIIIYLWYTWLYLWYYLIFKST